MTYEILTITNPEVDEKGQKDLSKKIQDLVKKENGKAISEANLGTKKLATPAEDQETGTYLSIVAQLKPESIKGIKKSLKSTAEIINVFIFKQSVKKGSILKTPEMNVAKVKKVQKAKKKTAKAEKLSARLPARQEAKSAVALREGGKVEKVEKPKPSPNLKKKTVKPEAKSEITTEIEGEEDRLKKLDDKLDEILKE